MGGRRIIAGERFGSLTALTKIHRISGSGRKRSHWICQCDCGETSDVDSGNLRNGNSTRCHKCAVPVRGSAKVTHGYSPRGAVASVYNVWNAMRRRATDKNNKDYAGRGIDIDPRWLASFEAFLVDVGEPPSAKHQIDREDNNRGYWPDNCKWSTPVGQANNKRNNIIITKGGKSQTLAEWCKELGINYNRAKKRYYDGLSHDEVLQEGFLLQGPCSYTYTVDGKTYTKLSDVAKGECMTTSGVNVRFNSPAFPSWTKEKVYRR